MNPIVPPKHIIVYVDDDPDDLELVKDVFSRHLKDIEVICFDQGSRALSYLHDLFAAGDIPCLVILDINMPVLDGKEMLVRLRNMEGLETVPVVLFSTSSLPADRSFVQQYNAGIVTKPLSIHQMEAITDQFIGHCSEEIRKRIRK